MADQYAGSIKITPYPFTPMGWLACDGSSVSRDDYPELFAAIGTTYGSNGGNTFLLPDLRGAAVFGAGTAPDGTVYAPGQSGGQEAVSLTRQQLASHTHTVAAQSGQGNTADPQNAIFAASELEQFDATDPDSSSAPILALLGNGAAHENRMPFLCLNYIIAISNA